MEPFTTFCPLLPGQEVNVLEVPIERKSLEHHSRLRSTSSAVSLICTLDPENRYRKPRGPPETEVPRRGTSTSISTILYDEPHTSILNQAPLLSVEQPSSRTGLNISHLSSRVSSAGGILADRKSLFGPESRRASFWTAFRPFRAIRSAFTSHGPQVERKASPVSQRLRPYTSPTTEISRAQGIGCFAPSRDPSVSNSVEKPVAPVACSRISPSEGNLVSMKAVEAGAVSPQNEGAACAAQPDMPAPDGTSALCGDNADQCQEQLSSLRKWKSIGHPTVGNLDIAASLTIALNELQVFHLQTVNDTQEPGLSAHTRQAATAAQADLDNSTVFPTLPTVAVHNTQRESVASQLFVSSSSQYTTNDLFSPSLSAASAFTGPISPYHLSQPGTPLVNDFGEDCREADDSDVWSSPMHGVEEEVLASAHPNARIASALPSSHVAYCDNGPFRGYSLPAEEQTSSLKLVQPASEAFRAPATNPPLQQKSGKQLVESWNDGSDQRTTGMRELLDDLSYLGPMIA